MHLEPTEWEEPYSTPTQFRQMGSEAAKPPLQTHGMEIHAPSGRFHLHICLGRAKLHHYRRQWTTLVPHQITVYILLAGKNEWFEIKIHPHSSPRGSSRPLLVDDARLSYSPRRQLPSSWKSESQEILAWKWGRRFWGQQI